MGGKQSQLLESGYFSVPSSKWWGDSCILKSE
jgi:hypothetical protein